MASSLNEVKLQAGHSSTAPDPQGIPWGSGGCSAVASGHILSPVVLARPGFMNNPLLECNYELSVSSSRTQ